MYIHLHHVTMATTLNIENHTMLLLALSYSLTHSLTLLLTYTCIIRCNGLIGDVAMVTGCITVDVACYLPRPLLRSPCPETGPPVHVSVLLL